MKHLILFSALTLAFISCEEDKVVPPDNTEILTSGTWSKSAVIFDKVVSVDVSGPDIVKAYMTDMDECMKDETFTFMTNFDMLVENPEVCEMNELASFDCNWIKINNSTFALDENCGSHTSPYTLLRVSNENTVYLEMESYFYEFPHDSVLLKYEWTLTKD